MKRNKFNIQDYLKKVREIVFDILDKPEKSNISYDILDPILENDIQLNVLRVKQKQMKYGQIWEAVIGEYNGFLQLDEGHPFGFDLINNKRRIVIELKNRYNTDNSSSRSQNYEKLSRFKKKCPTYRCVYGVINDKKQNGSYKEITNKGQKIRYISGDKFFEFVFGDDKDLVISTVKKAVSDYMYGKI